MSLGQIVILLYAILMLVGGFAGYATAGSKASLYSGAGSAVALAASWVVSRSSPPAGYWMAAVVSLLLCIAFAMRLAKTAKFMPSGMLLLLSLVALVLLTWSALGASGRV